MFEAMYRLVKIAYVRAKYFILQIDVNAIQNDPERYDSHQRYIHRLAKTTDIAMLQEEIFAGADVNAPDRQGNTPLHLACSEGNFEAVELLIAEGANLNAPNNGGFRPLTFCVAHEGRETERKACIEALIKTGAETNYVDSHGDTFYDLCAIDDDFHGTRQPKIVQERLRDLIKEQGDFSVDSVKAIPAVIFNKRENVNKFANDCLNMAEEEITNRAESALLLYNKLK